jgi:hypothetical protein
VPWDRLSILRSLRSVSKRLSLFADSVLYRTIVLQEDNVSQEQASYRCIERLLDATDTLRRYVRFLHIKSFRGDEASLCMNTQLLLACLRNAQKLESFRCAISSFRNALLPHVKTQRAQYVFEDSLPRF